jgi:hypothetical protein
LREGLFRADGAEQVLAFDEGAAVVGAGAAPYPTSAMELTSNSVYDPKVLFFFTG